jgi:S-DNA-T family DNA segregation ATPase FtsK/SpoIIIE
MTDLTSAVRRRHRIDAAPAGRRQLVITEADVGEQVAQDARTRLRLEDVVPPPMELRVTIAAVDSEIDLVLHAGVDAPVAILAEAAAREIGATPRSSRLWCERRSRWLDPGTAFHATGVRWGDRLVLDLGTVRPQPKYAVRVPAELSRSGEEAGRVDYSRAPRIARPSRAVEIELDPPPAAPAKSRMPWLVALIPMLAGVVMWRVTHSVYMLVFAGLSPAMALGTYLNDLVGNRKDFREQLRTFHQTVTHARTRIDEAVRAESVLLHERFPAPRETFDIATRAGDRLWERRRGDGDFLALRLGLTDTEARSRVTIGRGGDTAARRQAHHLLQGSDVLVGVPCSVVLGEDGPLALTGERGRVEALGRWLVGQVATLHSPADVVIAAAIAPSHQSDWEWLKWLPHASIERSPFDEAPLVTGDVAARRLLGDVAELCRRRVAERRERTAGAGEGDAMLVLLLDGELRYDRALLSETLSLGCDAGVAVIWMGERRRDVPGDCQLLVELPSGSGAVAVIWARTGARDTGVRPDSTSKGTAEAMARVLAPLRDVTAASTTAVPRRVALVDLIDTPAITPSELIARWAHAPPGLAAPIGAGAGRACVVDLRADGPHALVAGTTGSGKSEMLRSWITSLAATYAPDRVTFLLVDYKGGAAFGPCASFPHVVGLVTDLDDRVVERALVSLDAELRRREALLAATQAKDMIELERRLPDRAPPALVIVVDEFAKLREEVPAFVDGVVDIAQRGRSLGVHMVLAAQSLHNAFTPAIRANTNLRIALRVSDQTESEDVIAAKDAAHIPAGPGHVGRGYVRTGHGMLEQFQVAYVSGRSRAAARPVLEMLPLKFGGDLRAADELSAAVSDHDTDLTALATAARDAIGQLAIPDPRRPWLPDLPAVLTLPRPVGDKADDPTATVMVGLVDDPAHQRQFALALDFERDGNIVVFGGPGSGKSTLLRTCAAAMAAELAPEDVQLYVIDGPGRRLAALEALPHCGGVVAFDDAERVDALLAMLMRRVQSRADAFSAAGFAGLSEARSDGIQDAGRIVLLLDDLGAFLAAHDDPRPDAPAALLERLMSTGRGAGAHVVATAERRGALPTTLAATVGRRLVLGMASADDMIALGVDPRIVRTFVAAPGRGVSPENLEFQVAVLEAAPDGPSQARALATLCRRLAAHHAGARVPTIPVLPMEVDGAELPPPADLHALPVGIAGGDLAVHTVDISERHFLVAGSIRTGRTTALATLVRGIAAVPHSPELHLMLVKRTPLSDLDVWTSIARGDEACQQRAGELLARAEEGTPIVVVVDDAGELSEMMLSVQLERLVRAGRSSELRIVAAAETGVTRGLAGPSWLRELRKDGNGLLLQPDLPEDSAVFNSALPRRVRAAMPLGRAFAVDAGRATLVQLAH